jgi:hypothetical protein
MGFYYEFEGGVRIERTLKIFFFPWAETLAHLILESTRSETPKIVVNMWLCPIGPSNKRPASKLYILPAGPYRSMPSATVGRRYHACLCAPLIKWAAGAPNFMGCVGP